MIPLANELEFSPENNEVLSLLAIPYQDRGMPWRDVFYKALPKAKFYNYGMAQGPKGKPYFVVCLSGNVGSEILSFDRVNQYAFDNQSGIIILSTPTNQVPEEVLHFGCVWSYKEYGDLRSCVNITSKYDEASIQDALNPFNVINNKKKDEIIFALPSEQFLPRYVRELITSEIQLIITDAAPTFNLVEQEKFILSHRICVSINTQHTIEQKENLEKNLTWFMPPYLPIYMQ